MISVAVVGMSCAITAAMSLACNGEIRPEMMATGLVAAVACNIFVERVTRVYRRRLHEANERLEQRVRERTAELEVANHELMVRDRMAAAGMVAAGVSHEIRSPLMVIKIAVDEVAGKLGTASVAELGDLLGDVSEATERISVILRDLSSLARPVDDPIGHVDLDAVIDSAARLAAYKLGRGMTLERVRGVTPHVTGNASRLVQLVMNLLHNAARATRADAQNTIRVETRTTPTTVELVVADTGTGMSPATRARLFEPFFTTGGATGGTGLGLSICRTIVERMGGTIHIDSELGCGTQVRVTLQRAVAAPAAVPLHAVA